MRLAGSTLIHASLPLEQTLRNIRALGFRYVEIDFFDWAHLDVASFVDDHEATTTRISAACNDADLIPIALSLGLHGALEEQTAQMNASSQIARELGVPYLTFQAAPKETSLEADIKRAGLLLDIALKHELTLGIETHFFVHTEDPTVARRYLEDVPGLCLTLDPSHYEAGPHWSRGYDDLLPYVSFIHIRSAGRGGWDEIQQPAGSGVIDYSSLLRSLRETGFDGDASIEYVEGAPGITDAAKEASRMREIIESTEDV